MTTDMDAAIRAELDRRGEPVSRLGYFCAPFRAAPGPLEGRVIKVYRSPGDRAALERLAAAHDDYVALLNNCGVLLPETEFRLADLGNGPVPVVIQEALPDASMMRPQMIAAERESAIALMESAGDTIATFWSSLSGESRRVGFHPSIRNFAVTRGQAIFFDTFPPLIGYSRAEMGELLLQFSEKRLMRTVGPLLKSRVTGIQDEWYSPPETLVGLVGSACRLRPDDSEAFLEWGRDFAQRRMAPWADEALAAMAEPPKLPGYWTTFRRVLGLQGEPNV